MNNPLEYLTNDKNNWYIDIPLIIARKSVTLTLGKGLLFTSRDKKILDFFNDLYQKDKWYEKLSKAFLQCSLLSKCYVMPVINQDSSISLVVMPNTFAGRVAKYNEQEQAAEFYFINEQADSATLTWVTIANGKVKYETFISNGPNEQEIILGSTRTKLKPNIIPKKSWEIKNPWNYLPIIEIPNLPAINLFGNSTLWNSQPDCYPVWNLIAEFNHNMRQTKVERTLNVTKGYGNLDNQTIRKLNEKGDEVAQFARDFLFNVGSAMYSKDGNTGMQIIQGKPNFSEYINDRNAILKLIYNGAMLDYSDYGDQAYTNKTQSLFNNKLDMQHKEVKQSFYLPYLYRLCDMIAYAQGLWNGIGERPYSIKYLDASMIDIIQQDAIINSRLANGTMAVVEAISEYDNVDELIAESKLQKIIKENEAFNHEEGVIYNGQHDKQREPLSNVTASPYRAQETPN